jgi:hypothetical protein
MLWEVAEEEINAITIRTKYLADIIEIPNFKMIPTNPNGIAAESIMLDAWILAYIFFILKIPITDVRAKNILKIIKMFDI